MSKRLDFVVAGAQKSGTTALWYFLRRHPGISLSDKKELHFFDNEKLDWDNPPYDQLHNHFIGKDAQSLFGEVTPIYIYWPPSMARIHAYNPDIKIIVSLRDPIERAYSHWRKETAQGREFLSFGEAIREGRRRVEVGGEFPGFHRVFSYVERGHYASQLARVQQLFPAKNVMVFRQADLWHEHIGTLDRICDFFGIGKYPVYPVAERVNSLGAWRNGELADCDIAYLENIYKDELNELSRRWGIHFR